MQLLKDETLPDGWLEDLLAQADLERSYALLRHLSSRHFYVEALKGRIRWLQLRFEGAWKHFEKACLLAESQEETVPSLVRRCLLGLWCFENSIAEEPYSPTDEDRPDDWIPGFPDELLQEHPEVRLIVRARRQAGALLSLHKGEYDDAAGAYREILEEAAGREEGQAAGCYLGLAACAHNQGASEDARRNMENAGLSVAAGGLTLDRGRVAGTLAGFHDYLGEGDAAGWRELIQRLACPERTRTVFLNHARYLADRCREEERLVLLWGG
ncbi:MAG: hypothetical protein HY721_07455 [Planctomycetes bacterium]|nr:hypothetical protein [Planctomycetota bacterium]